MSIGSTVLESTRSESAYTRKMMTFQSMKKLLPMIALSVTTFMSPCAHSAVLPNTHPHTYEVTVSAEVLTLHDQWMAGAVAAAKQFGCTNVAVAQQSNETVAEAVKLFGMIATQGSCLVLAPVSTNTRSVRYSFARGGTINGIDLLYISDTSNLRVWNGIATTP